VNVEDNPSTAGSEDTADVREDLPTQRLGDSMEDFYGLTRELLLMTAIASGILFLLVWWKWGINTAASYLVGAAGSLLYVRLLAREVASIGTGNTKIGGTRLALFVALMLVALKWDVLQFLPVFLGFLTYKAALLIYSLRTVIGNSGSENSSL
jgi:ATP synthase protein I